MTSKANNDLHEALAAMTSIQEKIKKIDFSKLTDEQKAELKKRLGQHKEDIGTVQSRLGEIKEKLESIRVQALEIERQQEEIKTIDVKININFGSAMGLISAIEGGAAGWGLECQTKVIPTGWFSKRVYFDFCGPAWRLAGFYNAFLKWSHQNGIPCRMT